MNVDWHLGTMSWHERVPTDFLTIAELQQYDMREFLVLFRIVDCYLDCLQCIHFQRAPNAQVIDCCWHKVLQVDLGYYRQLGWNVLWG